ncbi:MAG TPA: LysM peptidoglycan-binding domain-containing protein, partial [Anaerolineales bacterium]|nr:LysM peptidoglycan-binding domain-containing protein [Anaerolineales bacterium]
MQPLRAGRWKILLAGLALFAAILACSPAANPTTGIGPAQASNQNAAGLDLNQGPVTPTPFLPPTRLPGSPLLTPTPDPPHDLPPLRDDPDQYVVQPGDTLNQIATKYGVGLDAIAEANDLLNVDYLEVGQLLTIPAPSAQEPGPDFKIIPDSELVYGPASAYFDVTDFIQSQAGYLAGYAEDVDEQTLTGPQIVERLAQEYSVNPRLLLAVLEYQSGWVTRSKPDESTLEYPMGVFVTWRKGLYNQLAWAADNLNRGYYLWRVNGLPAWILIDGTVSLIAPTINAGTAGVQHLFSQLYDYAGWQAAVSEKGLFATYNALFGYPFDYAIEPLVPPDLDQPVMQMPFESGQTWAFTGGPHGGWGSGS